MINRSAPLRLLAVMTTLLGSIAASNAQSQTALRRRLLPALPMLLGAVCVGWAQLLVLISLAILAAAGETQAASFNCAKATSKAEKAICTDPALSGLDKELAKTYAQAREKAPDKESLIQAQRTWVKTVRDVCPDTACMVAAYVDRIARLQLGWEQREEEVRAQATQDALKRIPPDMPCIGANEPKTEATSPASDTETLALHQIAACMAKLLEQGQFDLAKQIIQAGHPRTNDWGSIMFPEVASIPEFATRGHCKTGMQRYEGKELEEIIELLISKGIGLNASPGFVDSPNTRDFVSRLKVYAERYPGCANKGRVVSIVNVLLNSGLKTNNFSEEEFVTNFSELENLDDLALLERLLKGGIRVRRQDRVWLYFRAKNMALVKLYEKYGLEMTREEYRRLVRLIENVPNNPLARNKDVIAYFRHKAM
ncbi:MAG: DUF1311 domain-containing protein [Betaproteobacteria bacterium]|nr:DUF1311 domain-containing protein [Betaproteobacteria bacterium]